VSETLNVRAKASIHGEVVCGKLSVEPGAAFSASCEMRNAKPQPVATAYEQQPETEKTE
jgi:cytoskeletal protein CcmA (bactofilin family)